MADYETLPHAPLTEALIDFGVSAEFPIDLDALSQFGERIANRYPGRTIMHAVRSEFALTPTGVVPRPGGTSATQNGYRFQSADATQVVQARTDGIAISRLRPYRDWGSLVAEARDIWEAYAEATGVPHVSRLALRYINRIEVPLPFSDFKEYFLTIPEVGTGIPQGLAAFFMRLTIPFEQIGAVAIINQTIDVSVDPRDRLPVIFDIELNRIGKVEGAEIWRMLESLRAAKNQVFFRSLTPKCLELFR
ncbi:MAG: TIGR04255 family protein [Gemmatimonadaceae bacterium]|nr:TIGR04255 family protein [Gemmatimonadaceae bacterium]